jgi:hypothetical protein
VVTKPDLPGRLEITPDIRIIQALRVAIWMYEPGAKAGVKKERRL